MTPGRCVAIVLWAILTGGFKTYLHYFNSYNKAYGSLGAVIILMLWMYLTGLALLVGGAINSVLTEMSPDSGAEKAQEDQLEHKIREVKKEQIKRRNVGDSQRPQRSLWSLWLISGSLNSSSPRSRGASRIAAAVRQRFSTFFARAVSMTKATSRGTVGMRR